MTAQRNALGTRRLLATGAVLALAVGLIPAINAQATEKDCGWNGDVVPLMERADRKVRSAAVSDRIRKRFGADAVVKTHTRMEVDLMAKPGATPRPTDAATLTRNYVTYNLQIVVDGKRSTVSAQVRFDGLCYRTTVVVDGPWAGSTGTDKPLKVSATRALKLAQAYRKVHQADYPLDEPLVMMNLMQSTAAPQDYGKLRWYVNYGTGMGGLNIIAVYMDGSVSPIRR